MKKLTLSMLMVLTLLSCGSRSGPPRNLDNACSIIKQKPSYKRAMKRTARKWDVPVHVQMAVIHQESRFVKDAKTPMKYLLGILPMGRQSSAYGYAQVLDGTWKEYKQREGSWGASRTNIGDATDFIGWYFNGSKRALGLALNDTRNQYLAYHEGRTGYKRGTYRRKSWLINVASKVQSRANMYERQLRTCL